MLVKLVGGPLDGQRVEVGPLQDEYVITTAALDQPQVVVYRPTTVGSSWWKYRK